MKIMLIYRPTPEGEAALAAARQEARARDGRILAVRHVRGSVEQPVPALPTQGQPSRDPQSAQDVDKLRGDMEALQDGLTADGISAEAVLLTEGSDPAEAFLEFARSEEVDLIVIGVRRRSPVSKLVMGSVAQDVVLRADCPVLTVKAED